MEPNIQLNQMQKNKTEKHEFNKGKKKNPNKPGRIS
jgi:hypothetical protein